MIYSDGYKLAQNGRVYICPRCENEQMFSEGIYCRICSTYLINECTNKSGYSLGYNDWVAACGHIADGNSRFCEYCGSKTTFFEQGLLKDWEEAKVYLTQQEVASSTDLDYEEWPIPF